MSDADPTTGAETPASRAAADRVCGPCTACCTILAVADLNKGNYVHCPNACGGCLIYDTRPPGCRVWSCGWLLGRIEGDERQRPDKLGLVFSRERLGGRQITVAFEVWPGAGNEPENERLLREMSEKMAVVLRQHQTRKCNVFAPDQKQQQYIEQLIQNEWYFHEYTQVIVSNVQPPT